MPDKSGLPSVVRGAGASRIGSPLAVRGTPGVECFGHCAASDDDSIITIATKPAQIDLMTVE